MKISVRLCNLGDCIAFEPKKSKVVGDKILLNDKYLDWELSLVVTKESQINDNLSKEQIDYSSFAPYFGIAFSSMIFFWSGSRSSFRIIKTRIAKLILNYEDFIMKIKNKIGLGVSVLALSSLSNAAADFSQLTQSINFDSGVTAVVAVGVALAALYGAIAGVRGVLRMIKGA